MTAERHVARRSVILRVLSSKEAEEHALEAAPAVAQLLGCAASPLSVLQATEKSQTYAFTASGTRLVAKVHADPCAMRREKLGLMLFRGGPVPDLVASSDDRRLLVMTWSDGRPFKASLDPLSLVVSSLARLHEAARRNLNLVNASQRQHHGLRAALAREADAGPARRLALACATLWGEDHVPVAVADLKPEHVLVARDACNLVDLETTSVGCSELHDLLSLVQFASDPQTFWTQWERGLAAVYLQAARLKPSASVAALTEAMRIYEQTYSAIRGGDAMHR